jgi:GTPase SAR1 family protein
MYDITRRDTFEHVLVWLKEVRKNGNPNMVIILVGNKLDMESKRAVTHDEGQAFAKEYGLLFMEGSAKTGDHVEECFLTAAINVMERVDNGVFAIGDESHGIRLGTKATTAPTNKSSSSSACC